MTPEQQAGPEYDEYDLVPALWRTDGVWHWDVMDVSTGNLVGAYDTWAELIVDFPEFAEAGPQEGE